MKRPEEDRFDHLIRTDAAFRRDAVRIGVTAIRSIVATAIRCGKLSIGGMRPEEARKQMLEYVQRWLNETPNIRSIVDYRRELLREARRAIDEKKPLIALLLYTTYIEHEVNDILVAAASRNHMTRRATLRLLKHSPLRQKLGPELKKCGLPPLRSAVAVKIRRISRVRNEFVHYKWDGQTDAQSDVYARRVRAAVGGVEKIVAELERYQDSELLGGSAEVFYSIFPRSD